MADIYQQRVPGPYDPQQSQARITEGQQGTVGQPSIFDSEVNLREEVADFIRNRGHKVVLRRATSHRCPNYDPASQEEHSKTCQYCMGTTYMYQDYVTSTYCRPAVDVEAQAKERRIDIGYLGQGKRMYYFTHNVYPKLVDYILEVQLEDEHFGDPVKTYQVLKIFDVQVVHPYRDNGGRIMYWSAQCAERPTGQ